MARRSMLSAVREQAGLVMYGFRLEECRLVPVGAPTRSQWVDCLRYLIHLERHILFWLGELMVYGEGRWGAELVRQMVETTGYDYETLRNLKWVASSVRVSERRENLSFAHHQEVAKLPATQQRVVLARAEREGWSHRQVRQETYRLTRPSTVTGTAIRLDPGLHHGDCREVLDRLPNRAANLLLSDPPYGLNYESPARIVPFARMANDTGEEAFALLDEVLAIAARKLAANSFIYIFTSWKTYSEMADVVANHFPLLGTLPWVKNNWGVGDLMGGFGEQHELIIAANTGPRLRQRESGVLHFDRVGTNQMRHPTEKPVPLLRHLVEKASKPGALVVDPFMGSGSTCVAARTTGRHYIGIEIDRQWFDVAQQRLAGLEEE